MNVLVVGKEQTRATYVYFVQDSRLRDARDDRWTDVDGDTYALLSSSKNFGIGRATEVSI